jgi:hypothetical protein
MSASRFLWLLEPGIAIKGIHVVGFYTASTLVRNFVNKATTMSVEKQTARRHVDKAAVITFALSVAPSLVTHA